MSSSPIIGIIALVLVICSVGAAAYFAVSIFRTHARIERVSEHGELATARVLALRDTGNRVNGQPVAAVDLEVQPPGGTAFRATAQAVVTAINAAMVQPGKQVAVRFDRANHSDVVILGVGP